MLLGLLATAMVVLATGCVGGAVAVRTGVVPWFDWQLEVTSRHFLLVHNRPIGPICPTAPPDVECAWGISGRRRFSVHYITPREYRLLVSFELPERSNE
jgi:hypothetical protein